MTKFALALPLLLAAFAEASNPASPSESPSSNPTAFSAKRWYPAWGSGARTCKDHTVNPTSDSWLLIQANGYLETSLQDCCKRYFHGTEYNNCITGGGGTVTPTNKYYPAWDQSPHTCAKDCAEGSGDASCGGILGPGLGTTYTTAAQCCAAHFASQKPEYCQALTSGTSYVGNNEWYLDASENICVKDCATGMGCGGVVKGSWVTLYPNVAACCAAKLPSINSVFCEAQSTGNGTAVATNLWHVSGSYCKKDCAGTGNECEAATAFDTLYETSAKCCATGLAWVKEDYCKTRSDPMTHGVAQTPFSNKWFVDYKDNLCKKDCNDASPACDSSATKDTILYDDAAACCKAKLSWLDKDTCASSSALGSAASPNGNSKWYADYQISPARCVQNCATGSAASCTGVLETSAGVAFFDDAAKCCEKKFSWYDPTSCQVKSTSAGAGFTDKYYVDYETSKCAKDCASATGTACAGSPENLGLKLFDTAEKCCKEKLSWINEDVCLGNALSADAGTDKWLVNYSEKKCVKDCALNVADPNCAGIAENKDGIQLFATMELCCKTKLGYINEHLCAARSNASGGGHTDKYYPDQGKGVCKKDCATSGGGACAGAPTELSTPLYDTAETCCKASVGWADSDTCQQISSSGSVAGTNKWYIDWSTSMCVKDCAASTGDASCGGLKPSHIAHTYTTPQACCSVHLSWKKTACYTTPTTPTLTSGPTAKPTTVALVPVPPTTPPTTGPTTKPTTGGPTTKPTTGPTTKPTTGPTTKPTMAPTTKPTGPTTAPQINPSAEPSSDPSDVPSALPNFSPSEEPSSVPSRKPSGEPTVGPSNEPSGEPSDPPSDEPSVKPSMDPSREPSVEPSDDPSSIPSGTPSVEPSDVPSMVPSGNPSTKPSVTP